MMSCNIALIYEKMGDVENALAWYDHGIHLEQPYYRIYAAERKAAYLSQAGYTADSIALDAYFVYPEELKSVARVQVFRDFLVAKAQRWHF